MKIAVFITGALKAFDYCYESINNNLILPNRADTFVCVWSKLGVDVNHLKIKGEDLKLNDRDVKSTDIYKFKNVKNYNITCWKEDYYKNMGHASCPEEVVSKNPIHYYSTIPVSYSNNVCSYHNDPELYDCVIKIRPDLKFNREFILNKNSLDLSSLYSCSFGIDIKTQISDKFVFGSGTVMKYYFSLFDKLNEYWKNVSLVGERLIKYHFDKSNIPVKYFPAPVKVVREDLR